MNTRIPDHTQRPRNGCYGHPRHRCHWRQVVPNPHLSENGWRRFHHRDLAELSLAEIWAERTQLEADLSWRIWRRRRPRLIQAWPTPIDDREWTLARLRVLRDEQARRLRDDDGAR